MMVSMITILKHSCIVAVSIRYSYLYLPKEPGRVPGSPPERSRTERQAARSAFQVTWLRLLFRELLRIYMYSITHLSQ